MAYSTETHDAGYVSYDMIITHTTTGIKASVSVNIYPDGTGTYPPETKRDGVFQAFLTQIAAMPNVTVNSAVKRGTFTTPVTP